MLVAVIAARAFLYNGQTGGGAVELYEAAGLAFADILPATLTAARSSAESSTNISIEMANV